MGLTLKGQESMWYAFSWIQALFPPLEEKDEVVPLERSLPVLSTPIHLFEAALFTQLSGWHRDGAPPIDLVDGEQLLDKLKELGLGVNIKKIEQVSVVPEFFKEI